MRKRNSSSLLKLILLGVLFAVALLFFYFHFIYFKRSLFISPIPFSYKSLIDSKDKKSTDSLRSLLSKNNIKFLSVEEKGDSSLYVKLRSGEEIFFSSAKSLDKQMSSLQLILSRLTIEGKRFSRLDLRFDQPVVTFKK